MKKVTKVKQLRNIIWGLERLNNDDNFRFEYDYKEVQKKLMNSYKDYGFDEGVQKERINSIKNMFLYGISNKKIAKTYNMTIEEVKKIIEISN